MPAIGQPAAIVLAASLALAVLLIVGNTIRPDIQTRRAEIGITKLVGGTDAFIRRPFLYRGVWYGLLGGLIAWLFAGAALTALAGPITNLADQYDSQFRLASWQLTALAVLLFSGTVLGLAGAWAAVARHLRAITPHR
jgi:cell division transport system permease protein